MIAENLKFVFQKTIGRVIESTILRYVAVQVGTNVGVPLLKAEIEEALQHDQPEAIRVMLIAALQKLEQDPGPPATAVIATEPTRVYRVPLDVQAVVTQQTI